ncbi:hypothetical protein [Roseateles sp. BYS87W]|uniref:Uncharacterized protein n=1 Tax=Pelomonas baiyunensis TaxID=3299026 RepID=A0ABW7GVM3_9BURK
MRARHVAGLALLAAAVALLLSGHAGAAFSVFAVSTVAELIAAAVTAKQTNT